MAKATAKTEPRVVGVTLELSLEEAQTLVAITGRIGGSPSRSPRGHVEEIANALRGHLGSYSSVPQWELLSEARARRGNVWFSDYPDADEVSHF